MKILHVVPTYVPAWRHGGPVVAVHSLAKALVGLGHQVTVFTTNVHGSGYLDVPVGVPRKVDEVDVTYFPVVFPRRMYRSPAMASALADLTPECDVVHIHSVYVWTTVAAARAARRAGVPYLIAPRGMLVPELIQQRGWLRKRLWLRLVGREVLSAAAGLHVLSELEARDARRLELPLPAMRLVPNGVDEPGGTDETTNELSPRIRECVTGSPFFLYLGRINWKKGLEHLVPALRHCAGARLALAGNDEESLMPGVTALARSCGVADRVVFLGPVHGADKLALLRHARALVLPSLSENFGNVVLEAMAAGCAVVVTPEVGLAAVVGESRCGVVCQGTPESIGSSLDALMRDPESSSAMGSRGRSVARTRFSWPAVASEMAGVYSDVCRGYSTMAAGPSANFAGSS